MPSVMHERFANGSMSCRAAGRNSLWIYLIAKLFKEAFESFECLFEYLCDLKEPRLQKMPPETVYINYSGHGMQKAGT